MEVETVEYLINVSSKGEFMDFLVKDTEGNINYIFAPTYKEILMNSNSLSERINYILIYSSKIDLILSNDFFKELFFLCDINDFYGTIPSISIENQKKLFKYATTNNISEYKIMTLFSYMNNTLKEELIYELKRYPNIYCNLLNEKNAKIVNTVLNEFNVDLTDKRIDLFRILENGQELFLKDINNTINIPEKYLNKELFNTLFKKYNVFQLRNIMNKMNYVSSNDNLSKYLKQKEDEIINTYDEGSIIEPLTEFYVTNYYEQTNIDLKNQCDRLLSNYIIDYHFEDNYHNVIQDITELLNFYYDGYISLSVEKVLLYQDIQNVDYFTIDEKKQLHNTLKGYNIVEMFYDDMAFARNIVKNAIKDFSLTKEELEKYKSEELSKEYGVPIYTIEDEPFFALVKSSGNVMDKNPTGHSYSLVGNNGLATFNDKSTYVYSSTELNPNQIVHVYPYDSYTLYRPFDYIQNATKRVWTLSMPDELVELNTKSYNEILILEQGREEHEIDKNIPKLRKIALYCVDRITENDIKEAQINDLGILFINSKKCKLEFDLRKFRHNQKQFDDYNYFDGMCNEKSFEDKRIK